MNTGERILGALKLGAMCQRQLHVALDVSFESIRTALKPLLAQGLVSVTKAANASGDQRARKTYTLCTGGPVVLGKVTQANVSEISQTVSAILREQGEVALFIGTNRMAAVAIHHSSGYEDALRRHHASLVGRYRTQDEAVIPRSDIVADMQERLSEISDAVARAA